ncbi:MAG TPA: radical SAM family heme chaperone HemW [Gemmatimonadaceae bacterium]|nr:radical SAM family heme chaperone HemW [Gemmatimonadaceae bacterium]
MPPRHIYVHVPFCARRCSYCDFSIAVRAKLPVAEYLSALRVELTLRYGADRPWPVDTIYLGGGTPSALGADVGRLMDLLREFVQPSGAEGAEAEGAERAEVTLEANPEHVTPRMAAAWQEAGVNRLSLGAQSFDPKVLAWMHRTHRVDDISRAVHAARSARLENVSLDLIFALPTKLGRDWDDDLNRALALDPAHISLYGLTVEPATPLARWIARGETTPADDAVYAGEFLRAHAMATSSGFDHYEVSNFTLPGRHSRHNSAYWSGTPYAGLGPSSHEFDGTTRRWNVAPYAEWCSTLRAGKDPIGGSEQLTRENQETERVYLGLRTASGLVIEPGDEPVIDSWEQQNWADRRADRAILTPDGWLRLDALATDLTYARSRS